MVWSKVFHTVMPPEGAVVRLRGGMQGLEDYLELGDPKGTNSTLKEGIVIPKLSYPIHMCTKECSSTH